MKLYTNSHYYRVWESAISFNILTKHRKVVNKIHDLFFYLTGNLITFVAFNTRIDKTTL